MAERLKMNQTLMAIMTLFVGLFCASCGGSTQQATNNANEATIMPTHSSQVEENETRVYALFETSLGDFKALLHTDLAPVTTQNFIDLAEGNKAFRDPSTGAMVQRPLFNGRRIFRIIQGFMFQTGSAADNNSWQSGFTIPDEYHSDLTFSKPGLLAMANTGRPNSGSCQFFITTGPEWAYGNNKYAIFGEVIEGMDTVYKIDSVPVTRNPADGEVSRPINMPIINQVTIIRD